jgi:hypothetical protein
MISSFVMHVVIPKISNVILEIPLESIDHEEIVDLLDSQSDPSESKSPLKKQKPNVVGVGKKQKSLMIALGSSK